jgi:ABC-type transport system involved in multi-copper enzyme maturation permease subunit
MRNVIILAGLTIKEAVRRKFVVAGFLIGCLIFLIALLPIHPFRHHHQMFLSPSDLNDLIASLLSTYGASLIEFFGFLFAVSLGAGAISGELERGVLSVIVPKPISRSSVYLGKLIGVNLFILPFTVIWTAILQFAIYNHVHYTMPALWDAIGTMSLYPLTFSALTIFFSSFTSTLLATVFPIIFAATAWSVGIVKFFAYTFDVDTLKTVARCIVYVVPLSPMSRFTEKVLMTPILQTFQSMMPQRGGPVDPPAGMLDAVWIGVYFLIFTIAGAIIFARRDLA